MLEISINKLNNTITDLMAKRRSRGGRRDARAVSRRERKAGLYMKPGDPEFKDLAAQLRVQGLRLRDVPGDG